MNHQQVPRGALLTSDLSQLQNLQEVRDARYSYDDGQEADYAGAAVFASTGNSQPPWLAVALAPLQEQINTIQAKLNTIQAQVTQIAGRQADFIRTMAKRSNWEGTGRDAILEIVPFPDGTYPSEAQPPLPPLNTVGAVRDLNHHDRKAYLDKYFPDQHIGGSPAEKTKKLLQALGCEDLTRN